MPARCEFCDMGCFLSEKPGASVIAANCPEPERRDEMIRQAGELSEVFSDGEEDYGLATQSEDQRRHARLRLR